MASVDEGNWSYITINSSQNATMWEKNYQKKKNTREIILLQGGNIGKFYSIKFNLKSFINIDWDK